MNPIMKTGDNLILCSGVVFTFDGAPLEIGIKEDNVDAVVYNLRFIFQNDETRTKGAFTVRARPDEQCSEITIFNCDATPGSGVLSPIRIATNASGEVLWLVYMITAWHGVRSKKIEYTVFKQKGGQNGHS